MRLYEEGLIYQGDYIINWCPRCHTALSDLESEHEEVKGGKLYYIRYPFKNGKGYLVVATTRPETILGDTAVAVNPDDPQVQGPMPTTRCVLPLLKREMPIIRDSYVSTDFGTGALKITPAHDPNDFEIGQKHGLAAQGAWTMTAHQPGRRALPGLDRFEARKVMLADLEKQGLHGKSRKTTCTSVGHCYRCKTMVEPILSKQWFVKVGPLADRGPGRCRTGAPRSSPSGKRPITSG